MHKYDILQLLYTVISVIPSEVLGAGKGEYYNPCNRKGNQSMVI